MAGALHLRKSKVVSSIFFTLIGALFVCVCVSGEERLSNDEKCSSCASDESECSART